MASDGIKFRSFFEKVFSLQFCSGYIAPEYALHGLFSTKVDVFSYGVLALEIVTGRSSSSFYDSDCAEDFLSYVSMASSLLIELYVSEKI